VVAIALEADSKDAVGLEEIALAKIDPMRIAGQIRSLRSKIRLEPISKSPEEDNEAGELDEAEKVVGVVFPADEDATLPLYPSEEAFDQPTSHVTT
jgi:hypothetical protein